MSADIIKTVKEKSQRFLDWITLNVDDENVIKAAIDFFEYNESALKAIIKLAQLDLMASSSIDLQNKSLNNLLQSYNVNRPFNYKEADRQV